MEKKKSSVCVGTRSPQLRRWPDHRQMLLVNLVRKSVMEETARVPGGLTKLEESTGGLCFDLFPTSLKLQLLGEYLSSASAEC